MVPIYVCYKSYQLFYYVPYYLTNLKFCITTFLSEVILMLIFKNIVDGEAGGGGVILTHLRFLSE